MVTVGAIFIGIVLLLAGGIALVHGASQIAGRLGVPPMVVGLTVVAFGTSMPELVVNMIGASRGATELAFGNVVGSNVANLALVLGAAAMIRPIDIQGKLVQRELPLLLLATAVATAMSIDGFLDGTVAMISRSDAVVLLFIFGLFLYITVFDFVRSRTTDPLFVNIMSNPLVASEPVGRFSALIAVAGIVLLYVGGEVTVRHSVELAERLEVSSAIVGLFVVAVGTSMPELVTSIVAAARGESDLALGNIVGSNLFNTLLVLPVSGLLSPVIIPYGGISDLILSLVFAASLIPIFVFGKARLGRAVGAVFLAVYFAWAIVRVTA